MIIRRPTRSRGLRLPCGDEPVHADDLRIALKLDLDVFGPALDKLLGQGAAHIDRSNHVTRANDGTGAWRRNYDTQVNFRPRPDRRR